MRSRLSLLFLLCITAGCAADSASAQPPSPAPSDASAAPAPAAPGALRPDSSVDEILDALDARGDGLQDFSANVKLTEADTTTGDETARTGTVYYQKQGDGDARLRVTLDKRITDRGVRDEVLEYLLDDGWLLDRNHRSRVQVRRQVLEPGQKLDLLKLGEGPFPLPLGQDKADVHKMFDVKKVDADEKTDPPGTAHVQLVPKPGSDFADEFASIDVWVDLSEKMPRRIETLNPQRTSSKTTDLDNVKVNTGLTDEAFTLKPVDPKKWQMTEEPYSG
jgi:outer membrane lipoprotein-sorting protein